MYEIQPGDTLSPDQQGEAASAEAAYLDREAAKLAGPIFWGYDGNGYAVGDRIEIHPGTDLWMSGARYGVVIGYRSTSEDRVRVRLDKTGSRVWSGPEDRFRFIDK